MAKIKTVKYKIEDKQIDININCNSKGMFSTNLHCTIADKLGLDNRLTSKSLADVEKTIKDAFDAYINAKTSYRLLIGITFGASGTYLHDVNNRHIKEYFPWTSNPYVISTFGMSGVDSVIGLDYRVIIEQNIDGRIFKYLAKRRDLCPVDILPDWKIIVGDYMNDRQIFPDYQGEKFIDYSEIALQNLSDITNQLRRASQFLIHLVTSKDMELRLTSKGLKLLK